MTAAQKMTLAVHLSRVERTEPLVFALVELLTDQNARLTAEVERLRAALKLHADGLERAGQGYFAQSLRAVLAPPTPAPEATE